jgi:hypothetical protein
MLQLWSTLLGGLLALVGSIGTNIYIQRKAPSVERRAWSRQAANELLSILIELRRMDPEPTTVTGSATSSNDPAWKEWQDRRSGLLLRLESQAMIIAAADVRVRLTFIIDALHSSDALEAFERINERSARAELSAYGMNCLGAYLRDERALPKESLTVRRARSALEQANAIIAEQSQREQEWFNEEHSRPDES